MKSERSRYDGYRFPPEIIGYVVWAYHRFCLSFRDVRLPSIWVAPIRRAAADRHFDVTPFFERD
jgi:hypothetical protein